MRYFFLLFCFAKLNAQTVQTETNTTFEQAIDTIIEIGGKKMHIKKLPGANNIVIGYKIPDTNALAPMPNAITQFKDQQKRMGNNNQGFDIYLSQIDNMLVLKPDEQNLASMPNSAKNALSKTPNAVYRVIQKVPFKTFKYIKPLSGNEKKLLELFDKK